MRLLIALLFAVIFAAPAVAQSPNISVLPQPDGSMIVLITVEAVKACEEQGGCRIVTGNDLEAFAAEVKKSCGVGI